MYTSQFYGNKKRNNSSSLNDNSNGCFYLLGLYVKPFNLLIMFFEDALDSAMLYSISPELTCQCDEVHTCQQCKEEARASFNEICNQYKTD